MRLIDTIESTVQLHLIGKFQGAVDGPTLVAVGSVHGNEPSGSIALERVAVRLKSIEEKLCGRVYLLAGNVRALRASVRFISSDLNRHWTGDNIRRNSRLSPDATSEDREQQELLTILREILTSARD